MAWPYACAANSLEHDSTRATNAATAQSIRARHATAHAWPRCHAASVSPYHHDWITSTHAPTPHGGLRRPTVQSLAAQRQKQRAQRLEAAWPEQEREMHTSLVATVARVATDVQNATCCRMQNSELGESNLRIKLENQKPSPGHKGTPERSLRLSAALPEARTRCCAAAPRC